MVEKVVETVVSWVVEIVQEYDAGLLDAFHTFMEVSQVPVL